MNRSVFHKGVIQKILDQVMLTGVVKLVGFIWINVKNKTYLFSINIYFLGIELVRFLFFFAAKTLQTISKNLTYILAYDAYFSWYRIGSFPEKVTCGKFFNRFLFKAHQFYGFSQIQRVRTMKLEESNLLISSSQAFPSKRIRLIKLSLFPALSSAVKQWTSLLEMKLGFGFVCPLQNGCVPITNADHFWTIWWLQGTKFWPSTTNRWWVCRTPRPSPSSSASSRVMSPWRSCAAAVPTESNEKEKNTWWTIFHSLISLSHTCWPVTPACNLSLYYLMDPIIQVSCSCPEVRPDNNRRKQLGRANTNSSLFHERFRLSSFHLLLISLVKRSANGIESRPRSGSASVSYASPEPIGLHCFFSTGVGGRERFRPGTTVSFQGGAVASHYALRSGFPVREKQQHQKLYRRAFQDSRNEKGNPVRPERVAHLEPGRLNPTRREFRGDHKRDNRASNGPMNYKRAVASERRWRARGAWDCFNISVAAPRQQKNKTYSVQEVSISLRCVGTRNLSLPLHPAPAEEKRGPQQKRTRPTGEINMKSQVQARDGFIKVPEVQRFFRPPPFFSSFPSHLVFVGSALGLTSTGFY